MMESKWLEDFVSLVEAGSFSRASEVRNVSQPAFSRRIQALEAWVGTELIDRSTYPTRLTNAGEVFYEQAVQMLAQIDAARAMAGGQRPVPNDTVDLALPHSLSLSFFPQWLTELERDFGPVCCRLTAGNALDCVLAMVEGGCDLMICFHHPMQPIQLDPSRFDMLTLGHETMSAFSQCDPSGRPIYTLPGRSDAPLPFLSYSPSAYLGRMVELIQQQNPQKLHLKKRYETDMAEGLKAMAMEGHGLAFLPESSVTAEVAAMRLARAGTYAHSIRMEIRLYRERKPGKRLVEQIWSFLSRLHTPTSSISDR